MDMMAGLQVSFSALNAQRTRMNVIASNLANAQSWSTSSPPHVPMRPMLPPLARPRTWPYGHCNLAVYKAESDRVQVEGGRERWTSRPLPGLV